MGWWMPLGSGINRCRKRSVSLGKRSTRKCHFNTTSTTVYSYLLERSHWRSLKIYRSGLPMDFPWVLIVSAHIQTMEKGTIHIPFQTLMNLPTICLKHSHWSRHSFLTRNMTAQYIKNLHTQEMTKSTAWDLSSMAFLCWCIHFFAAFEFSDWVDPCVTLYITSLHLIRQTVSHTEHVLQRNLERSKHEFRTRWSWWSCGRKPSCLEKCSDGLVPRKRIAPQIWRIARGNARVVKGRMLLQPIPSICLLIYNIYEIYYIGTPSGNVPETQ